MKLLKCFAISLMGTAAGMLLYCGSFYVKAGRENLEEQSRYERMEEECTEEGFGEKAESRENQKKDIKKNTKKNKKSGSSKKKPIRKSFGISWEKLGKTNPDTIAWLKVPGADISYPVVKGTDDEFYLTHSIAGEKSPFGSIFLGSAHKKNFMDSHSLVYGHNMEGGLMFANLNRYEAPEFLEKCPEFYIITPKRKFCYRIFSVEQAAVDGAGFLCGFELGSEAYREQLKTLKESSLYDTGVDPDEKCRMVTLVTCNSRLDTDLRMAVHGICTRILRNKSSANE